MIEGKLFAIEFHNLPKKQKMGVIVLKDYKPHFKTKSYMIYSTTFLKLPFKSNCKLSDSPFFATTIRYDLLFLTSVI